MKRTRMPQRRATPRRSERVRNPAFLAFVHELPCAAIGLPGHVCAGRIEADHAGDRPIGRKADDDTCIALCSLAHRQRTDMTGPFREFTRAEMRSWLDGHIAETRGLFYALPAGVCAPP